MHKVLDPARLERVGELCRRYVDDGKYPCSVVQVKHRGEVAYLDVHGWADVVEQRPIQLDSVFRIFSMSKPITSVALMQLHEQGLVYLDDPVSAFIPEFADLEVYTGGGPDDFTTEPLERPMIVKDLLTHTSGLTYGFMFMNTVDKLYRDAGLGGFDRPTLTLAEAVPKLATLPLLFQPGSRWGYSVATDVVGRLVEVISGMSFGAYLEANLFEPLGMVDTGFSIDRANYDRTTSLYTPTSKGLTRIDKREKSTMFTPPTYEGGGGGLASTLADYQAFCDMLVNGGEHDGVRILGASTVEFMMRNHLPGERRLNEMQPAGFSETAFDGMGFGLGFSVLESPAENAVMGSVGQAAWGGAASTAFWIDPVEDLTCIFLTQLMPSSTYPIRRQLRTAVYQAMT